jgi:hypothetical protein
MPPTKEGTVAGAATAGMGIDPKSERFGALAIEVSAARRYHITRGLNAQTAAASG